MNYLAHAFLSGDEPGILVGNFIADHVRGDIGERYTEMIRKGIRMHREIDTFTDAHPSFRAAKKLFYKDFERYSGILVDIYFDFFLASDFQKYSKESLKVFSDRVYLLYKQYEEIFPEKSLRFFQYVLKNNIYESYSRIEGIERVLYHLSHRMRHDVNLERSVPVFEQNRVALHAHFTDFFSEAVAKFR
jgi:acyl carrier protein phosphodiesterase